MKIIRKITGCKDTVAWLKARGQTIGLVPTMGYLHRGHLSLVELARAECDTVFLTIFVNPTQFGPDEDFKKYPRDLERDAALAEKAGVDYIFYPEAEEIYGDDYKTYVEVEELPDRMCGEHRNIHFRGVTTVVLKLFNIISAHKAYFGEKDYQQLVIIKKMASDLNLDIQIVPGTTIREDDGLALSSRNKYLSPEERENATIIYENLKYCKKRIEDGGKDLTAIQKQVMENLARNDYVTEIDYFDFRDAETLEKVDTAGESDNILIAAAVWVGKTRLIDNIVVKKKK